MTTPAGRGTKYDHEQIRNIARQLQRELTRHSGPGTIRDLTSRGKPPAAAFGTWDAAQALGRTVDHGNAQITRAYQQFMDGFLAMVDALEKAADNYQQADEKMLTDINSVGAETGQSPTNQAPTRTTVKPME